METLWQDVRYGARMLMRNPAFTCVAVTALALGIGANTAIFSVVNAVLLRPLPYKDPERLVTVWEDHQSRGGPAREWTSPPTFLDWREQNQVFEHVAAFQGWSPTHTGDADPERLRGLAVSHDFFTLLGIEPSLGRTFRPEEDQRGAEGVVILSHGLWQRRFGSDPALIGKSLTLNGEGYSVVGIMPAPFKFPGLPNLEIWRTLRPILSDACGRGCVTIQVIARLRPGITMERARSDMSTIAARLEQQYPSAYKGVGVTIVPLHEQLVGDVRRALLVLLGAVGFVLLIACANVANLMLARAAAREREIAVRAALGASRKRLVRQLLTESLILALISGATGLLLAYRLVDLLVSFSPPGTPRAGEIGVDTQVLIFTLGIALLTALLFGITPAFHCSKPELSQSLKEGSTRSTSGAREGRVRSSLIVAEVALALILLIGAGLLMKSFLVLQRLNPGFDPANVLTLDISLPRTVYPDRAQISSFSEQLIERIRSLPAVDSAAATSSLPMSGSNSDTSFIIEGQPAPLPGLTPVAWYSSITPEYFRTMRIRLLRGREFTRRDGPNSPRVIVITEALARRYWPNEDPIGKRVGFGGGQSWREIVGIVSDVRHFGLDTQARPSMYFPQSQTPDRQMTVVARTLPEPVKLAASIRTAVWSLDKNLAVSNVGTLEGVVAESISARRFVLLLLGIFATVAMILAAVGLYGVMSYSVSRRTHEIGIRMTLGAKEGDVLRLVVGQGMLLAIIGILVGGTASLALTQVLSTLLYEVSATDAVTFACVSALLALVGFSACYLPARRATRVDPMVALRYE